MTWQAGASKIYLESKVLFEVMVSRNVWKGYKSGDDAEASDKTYWCLHGVRDATACLSGCSIVCRARMVLTSNRTPRQCFHVRIYRRLWRCISLMADFVGKFCSTLPFTPVLWWNGAPNLTFSATIFL